MIIFFGIVMIIAIIVLVVAMAIIIHLFFDAMNGYRDDEMIVHALLFGICFIAFYGIVIGAANMPLW